MTKSLNFVAKSLLFSSKNPMPTMIAMIIAMAMDQEVTEAILTPMATEKTEMQPIVEYTRDPPMEGLS